MNTNLNLDSQNQTIQALVTTIISSAENIKLIVSQKKYEDVSFNFKIINKSLKDIKKATALALKFTKQHLSDRKPEISNQNLGEHQLEELRGLIEPQHCRGETEGSEIDIHEIHSLNAASQFSDSLDRRSLDTEGHYEEMMQEMQEMDITILYLEKRLSRLSSIEERLNPFYDDEVDEAKIRKSEIINLGRLASQCVYNGAGMRYAVRIGRVRRNGVGPANR